MSFFVPLFFADYQKSGNARGPLSPKRAEFKGFLRNLCARYLSDTSKLMDQPREYGDLWQAFLVSRYATLLKQDAANFSVATIRRELESFHN